MSRRINLCISSVVILAISAEASAQFTFAPPSSYQAFIRPSGVAVADFNGDGHVDFATVADNPDRVVTFLNNGSGQFTPGPGVFLPNGSSPQDLIAGDFNGNGMVDIAVALRDPFGQVMILVNTGNGFVMGRAFAVGARPRGLSVGDINADGRLDLAVANRDANTASVLINTTAGGGPITFAVQTLNVGLEPRATSLLDVNLDGWLDLAVTNHESRTVSVFANTNGTSFMLLQTLNLGTQVRPDGIVAADFNNDGRPDLAVAISGQTPPVNAAAVYLNSPTGFGNSTWFPTGGVNTGQIAAADFDCDGWIDLVTTNQDSNDISVLRNLGGGSFGSAQILPAGTRPGAVATGAFTPNRRGIVVANRDSDNLTVYLNQTSSCVVCAPADIDCDGVVNVNDLLAVINAWGPCPAPPASCPADIFPQPNGDGVVNVNDLLMVINNWG